MLEVLQECVGETVTVFLQTGLQANNMTVVAVTENVARLRAANGETFHVCIDAVIAVSQASKVAIAQPAQRVARGGRLQ